MMPEKRSLSDCLPHFFCWDLKLAPLEDQNPVRFQHSHTLPKSVSEHYGPVLVQLAVFFYQPSVLSRLFQMRRVPNHKRKRIVLKRQIGKITLYVWLYRAIPDRRPPPDRKRSDSFPAAGRSRGLPGDACQTKSTASRTSRPESSFHSYRFSHRNFFSSGYFLTVPKSVICSTSRGLDGIFQDTPPRFACAFEACGEK